MTLSKEMREAYGRLDQSLDIAVCKRNGRISVHDGVDVSLAVESRGGSLLEVSGSVGENDEISVTGNAKTIANEIESRLSQD